MSRVATRHAAYDLQVPDIAPKTTRIHHVKFDGALVSAEALQVRDADKVRLFPILLRGLHFTRDHCEVTLENTGETPITFRAQLHIIEKAWD